VGAGRNIGESCEHGFVLQAASEHRKKTTTPLKIPESIDFDLWCGPGAERADQRKSCTMTALVWPTGNGILGNQGIHEMDVARWRWGG